MTKSTITREQRINEVKELIANAEEWAGYYEHPIHDKPQREIFEGMARVMAEHLAALTAMDSEPVAYADPQSFDNFKSNGGENAACTKEWMWRDHSAGLIPLYRHAQPAKSLELAGWQFKSVNGDWLGLIDEHGKNQAIREGCEVREVFAIADGVNDRDNVRREHAEWSQATFGSVGPVGPLKHLSKEALEAAAEPGDLSEWADMQFLLWDAQRRAGITDEQIAQAMIEKLAVNKQREWPEPKDGEPRLHIKEQPVPKRVHKWSYGLVHPENCQCIECRSARINGVKP